MAKSDAGFDELTLAVDQTFSDDEEEDRLDIAPSGLAYTGRRRCSSGRLQRDFFAGRGLGRTVARPPSMEKTSPVSQLFDGCRSQ